MAGGTFSEVDALVMKGDTIIYTGTVKGAQQAAGPGAAIVDLQGRCVLPGFIEPHLHLIMTALADNYLLKLSPNDGVTTLEIAKEKIEHAIKPDIDWIAGYGYDPSRVTDHLELNIDILDGINKEHPIFIMNQSGHVAYVNSMALQRAGITPTNADLNYQRVNGKLTGIIYELAVGTIGQLVPQVNLITMAGYCQSTLTTWASAGCTTIFDAGIGSVGSTDIPLLKFVTTTSPPPVRFYGAVSVHVLATDANIAPLFQPPIKLGNVEVQAVKLWADGSTQGFTAALNQPYFYPPTNMPQFGTLNYPDENSLYKDMAPWWKAGFQILVHANGDRATQQTLNVYEAILKANPSVSHAGMHRIEHFTVTEPGQLTRAKNLGLAISHTIGHVNYWGSTFENYVLDSDRAKRIDPLNSDEKAGLIWSLHSDSPVTAVNPLMYLKTATTRLRYPDGGVLGKDECVDLQTALRGITINPATQIGIEKIVGTLEVGKKADIVILNQDPRKIELADLDQLCIEQTWMGGIVTHPKPLIV